MSGRTSRTKGQAGERELAGLIRDITGWDVRRKVRQHEGDSDLEGIPGWSCESKRHKTATRSVIEAWYAQACRQAKGKWPVLFYRLDRAEWRAMWPLAAIHWPADAEQAAQYHSGPMWAAETSVEAWASVARETKSVEGTAAWWSSGATA